ncbi:DNA polymerase II subunit B4-like [Humulus lupulus]|uniref:DNA polymerase II subunit B4-like n=1 Tax=Humulus lupulus TaxID=3486 RepID=UPI002B40A560|nr:DNA polymerase II subunit B4-like [Humulus lupulus]XP_062083017.1 DNA polymerase II subunit B4-like [Humulus lupulus]
MSRATTGSAASVELLLAPLHFEQDKALVVVREREREMEKAVAEAEELPKAIVRRVVKDKLSHCAEDTDFNVHKDALLAFSESARIFIHYLSATANDICKESKRQTISGDDVLKALEEIEFSEFLNPLNASLVGCHLEWYYYGSWSWNFIPRNVLIGD